MSDMLLIVEREFNERVCFTEESAKHHKFERK